MVESVVIRARAPVRVDFAGGWTDVPTFARAEGGAVTNAALARYVHIECLTGGGKIRLHAEDLHEHVTLSHPSQLVYDGRLDLHKAALNMFPVTGGVEILSRSEVPAGSGLGGSGALDVALVAALTAARHEPHDREDLAELGFQLEAGELGLAGGRQDQYAAALGGWHELAFDADGLARATPIDVSAAQANDLLACTVVAYTGESHFSAQTHRRVWDAYAEGRSDVVGALRAMRDLAGDAAAALRAGDWERLAGAVARNWREQRRLDATIATARLRDVDAAAHEAGAWGLKATGAGAGGCVVAIGPPNRVADIRRAVERAGASVLPCAFDFGGVQVEQEEAGAGARG